MSYRFEAETVSTQHATTAIQGKKQKKKTTYEYDYHFFSGSIVMRLKISQRSKGQYSVIDSLTRIYMQMQ